MDTEEERQANLELTPEEDWDESIKRSPGGSYRSYGKKIDPDWQPKKITVLTIFIHWLFWPIRQLTKK